MTAFSQCNSFSNMPTWRIEGEIEGTWDNGYHDATIDRDYAKMLELEAYMMSLHLEIERRGEIDDSGIPYDTFGNPRRTSNKLIRYYKRISQIKYER